MDFVLGPPRTQYRVDSVFFCCWHVLQDSAHFIPCKKILDANGIATLFSRMFSICMVCRIPSHPIEIINFSSIFRESCGICLIHP